MNDWIANADRYTTMPYRRCGTERSAPAADLRSGSGTTSAVWTRWRTARAIIRRSFDLGITHFDLANNYGPPPGSAEETFGLMLKQDLLPYRDELVISTKAGYLMWPGPYGEWGSRKYLARQSGSEPEADGTGLRRHLLFAPLRSRNAARRDHGCAGPCRPLRHAHSMPASPTTVLNTPARAAELLRAMGTPCLIHQPVYNMFNRWIEGELLETLDDEGMGCIVFSPLAQGLLSRKYLGGHPCGFARRQAPRLPPSGAGHRRTAGEGARARGDRPRQRGQSIAQLALSWVLRHPGVTSALVGASTVAQMEENVAVAYAPPLTADELAAIDRILA